AHRGARGNTRGARGACPGPCAEAAATRGRAWARTQNPGTGEAAGSRGSTERTGVDYALVAGLTPGLSLKNCLFMSMKFFQLAGVSSSAKIAFTGQTGSHAPQSMHSSGWM